jgi:diguanylate cyclase (GGDEF)-like protein
MTPTEIHGPREATAALDDQLARSLRLLVPAVAAIYAVALLSGAEPVRTSAAAMTTIAFLALGLLLTIWPLPSRLANPLLVGGLAVVALEVLVRGSDAAPGLELELLGAGAVALRPRWAVAAAVAVLGPWLVVSMTGLWGWAFDGRIPFELAAAATLATVVFEARHGSISGLMTARGAMHALALADPLTGLLNRRGIEEEASRMLSVGAKELSIVFLDLDGFKAVNDRLGHAEGDRALQAMAGILLETFRAADAVGRIGGDEFVVVVAPGSDVAAAARRLELRLATWREAEDRYTLRASIGTGHLASATLDGFWEAVDAADRRMYLAKQARREAADAHPATAPGMVPALL